MVRLPSLSTPNSPAVINRLTQSRGAAVTTCPSPPAMLPAMASSLGSRGSPCSPRPPHVAFRSLLTPGEPHPDCQRFGHDTRIGVGAALAVACCLPCSVIWCVAPAQLVCLV